MTIETKAEMKQISDMIDLEVLGRSPKKKKADINTRVRHAMNEIASNAVECARLVERCLALLILDVVRNPECVSIECDDEATKVSPNDEWKETNQYKTLKGSLTKAETKLEKMSETCNELQSELADKTDEIEKLKYKVKTYTDQAGAKV